MKPNLWRYVQFGEGKKYSDNQAEDMVRDEDVMKRFDDWTRAFAAFVLKNGKVEPGRFRAYGYRAPGHRVADLKLKWRELRMGLGTPPAGSSPARQQKLRLNRDATLSPKTGEGEKLRKDKEP